MNFNDTSTKLGIVQEIDDLCDTNATNYPLAAKTRRVNSALETLISKIITADGTWQFDDPNFTTLPVGIGTLQEGVSSYSFADDFLAVESVEVKDVNGVWRKLTPFDPYELGGLTIEEYFGTASGFPSHYDKNADTIKMYPAPTSTQVTLASGLRITFKRTGSLFTASDTTKEPGIASPWHITIAKMAALPYCKTYKKDRVPQLVKDIDAEIKEMLTFYARRSRDEVNVMDMERINHR